MMLDATGTRQPLNAGRLFGWHAAFSRPATGIRKSRDRGCRNPIRCRIWPRLAGSGTIIFPERCPRGNGNLSGMV
jgi:hypothetical protein